MTLQNDDLILVNRGGTSFKAEYGLLKQNIIDGSGGAIVSEDAPDDDLHEGDFWYKPSTETLYIYVVNETTGVVTGVTVRNGGSGYNTSGTDVSTDGGSGSELTIDYQAGVGGALANPTVNQGGHAYEVNDVVFVTGSGHANSTVNVTAVNAVAVGQWVTANDDYWERTGTTLKPANAGDGVEIGANKIKLNADGTSTFAKDATINGLTVGLGAGDIGSNTAIGSGVLSANTTGGTNTATGFNALSTNTKGQQNVAYGYRALLNNTEGKRIAGVGYQVLFNNTTGGNNVGVGFQALYNNTTGDNNVGIGYTALNNNDTGKDNVAVGYTALNDNTTGINNVGVGQTALYKNITGKLNVAIGKGAGYYVGGSNNTILGGYVGPPTDSTLNNTIILAAGTTEKLRIDSSGKLLFGGTLPAAASITLNADGSAEFADKVTSASTVSTDSGTTLATKDYVDANSGPQGGTGTDAWATYGGGAIQADFNIASVVKDAVGRYTFNFTTPMPSADYSVQTNTIETVSSLGTQITARTASSFTVLVFNVVSNAATDPDYIMVQVNATNATLPTSFTRAEIQSVVDLAKEGFATRIAELEAKVQTLEADHATAMNNMNGGY